LDDQKPQQKAGTVQDDAGDTAGKCQESDLDEHMRLDEADQLFYGSRHNGTSFYDTL
jgi:hypothetical protein